ncbi:MAG TPA: J domain-containing protein [Bryobacteraceae bacterium]|nr:J domain-containing protein [Bryobacteraceae bacterium]
MATQGTWQEIEVEDILHVTPRAILCRIRLEQIWIPRSQIVNGDYYDNGFCGTLTVSDWWLRKNNLEYLADPPEAEHSELPSVDLSKAHRIYRRLAAKYHPDHSPRTLEMMKDLNELWDAVTHACDNRNRY